MVQFSENIAQYMLPNEPKQPLITLLRALSVSSFFLGSMIGARLGARFGDKKRGWIVISSIIQSIFLFGASAILLSRPVDEAPNFQYWPGVVVMTAFSMGMQSIAAQKLVSPAFATVSQSYDKEIASS
jgi:MFS family permease